MIKESSKYLFIILISSFLFYSCNNDVVYIKAVAMPAKTWKLTDVPVFSIPITDTLVSNSINFVIRTGTSYPFRNIFLFVSTSSPDGNSRTDTLQYYLADETGKWFGKGFGDIHELKLPFRSNVFFPQKGTYQIKVQHGMRDEDLEGVYDFGLKIERTGK
jgi:gliding motility-associated lipoprotein GldH